MMPHSNLNRIMDGWFSETSDIWPGIALSIGIKATLFSQKSRYQQVDVYETRHHGRMLVLDGIIQLTGFDEFAYQEMLVHTPLFAHPSPETVLVIGGGDGGVLREIARHPDIRTIDICEIDSMVIDVSKRFLPEMSCGFDDPRVSVHIADGNELIRRRQEAYDIIIVDSSDPVGPCEILFEQQFYSHCRKALKKNGILAIQGESFFLHPDKVRKMVRIFKELFSTHAYSNFITPTFTGGHIGICLGTSGSSRITVPERNILTAIQDQLKFYTPKVHAASFVLPHFAAQLINSA